MYKKSITTKLFFTFILFGIILIGSVILVTLNIAKNSIKDIALNNAKNQFFKERNILDIALSEIEPKVITIANSSALKTYFQNNSKKEIKQLFSTLMQSNNNIHQIRFINLLGEEKLKIERKDFGAIPYFISDNQLQNKKHRYYFKEFIQLPKQMTAFSKIDLNIEHSQIQIPYNPVIRIGSSVYYQKKKMGIVVINIFMKQILSMLQSSKLYNIYLIDKDGYFLIHPNEKYNWSRYLHPDITIQKFFPDSTDILSKDTYMGKNFYSARINLDNPDQLRLIIQPTKSFLNASQTNLYKNMFINFIILLIIAIILALILSRPFYELQEKLRQSNKNLQKKVKEKTKELIELNKTLEKKIKERTKEQNVLLSLFDLGNAVLFKWKNDKDWSVASVSQSVEKLLGYTQKEFLDGKISYAQTIHPEDLNQVIQEVEEAIEKQLYFFTHKPYRIITKNKQIKWIHDETVIVRDEEGNIINFVGYLIDITTIKENEIKLKILSTTDKLTQIYNRLYLDNILQKQYYRLKRHQETCSLILMDIDHFKSINDQYGHLVGDTILKEITKLIQNNLRQSDIFGRWGGEEFLIIAPHTSLNEAKLLAEKLRFLIQSHYFEDVEQVTMSFGVVECKESNSIDENIKRVDTALYISKKYGRNQVNILE